MFKQQIEINSSAWKHVTLSESRVLETTLAPSTSAFQLFFDSDGQTEQKEQLIENKMVCAL